MKKLTLLFILLYSLAYGQGQLPKYASRNWSYLLLNTAGSGHISAPNSYTLICTGCTVDSANRTLTVTSGSSGSITIDTTSLSGGTIGNILFHKTGNVVGELSSLSTFETDLESFLDLSDLQGAVANTQVDSDLACLGNAASNGIFARTGAGTCSFRTVTGTSNEIDVANGDGVSGNPTLSISATPDFSGKVLQGASPLVFEGNTADANETTINITDPSADRTFTIPNAASVAVQGATCSGDDKVSAINATTGAITCTADVGSSSAEPDIGTFYTNNRFHYCQTQLPNSTTILCSGTSATITTAGTVTAQVNPNIVVLTTSTTLNATASATQSSSSVVAGCPYNTETIFTIRSPSSLTSTRFWAAITLNETASALSAVSTSTTSSAVDFIGVGYDAGGASNTANFHITSGDGVTVSDTDTGISVSTNTTYKIKLTQTSASATYNVTINGVSAGSKSTNLPACSAAGNQIVVVTNLAAGATRTVSVHSWSFKQPYVY